MQNKWKTRAIVASPVTTMALWGFSKKDDDKNGSLLVPDKKKLLAKADELFKKNQYQEVYDLLKNYKVY